jgi:prefoldin subunit 5
MALEVQDGTFLMVQLPNGQSIHQTEDEAIEYLQNRAQDVDPETDDVNVVRVSVENEDWTIAEMSWQNIALRLMERE